MMPVVESVELSVVCLYSDNVDMALIKFNVFMEKS